MDFGLARREDREESLRTRAGQQLGTPAYMPLEQFQGRVETHRSPQRRLQSGGDPLRTDDWAAAVRGELARDLREAVETSPPAPSSIRQGLDTALDGSAMKAMAREVEDRFGSMRELNQALGDYLRRGGGRGRGPFHPRGTPVASRSQPPLTPRIAARNPCAVPSSGRPTTHR